jgi:diguanylate cyclase (GGDEF)-like protein/PAS domain S-box-containing protein
VFAPKPYDGYRDLFLRHPQPMWVYEVASLRFLDVNDAACAVYGYSRADFLEMTTAEIRPAQDRRLFFEFVHAQDGDSPRTPTLWRHKKADGTIFYVDVVSQSIDFHGTPAHIVIATDATARLAVSRALSESRAALAEAQELAHLGSFDTDYERDEVRWSAELFRILGVDPARERPRKLYEFDHPEDREAVMAEIARARATRTPYTSEHRIVRRDGTVRVVFERGRYFYRDGDDGDEPTRGIGAVLDITDRKRAEERLREMAEYDSLTGLPNRALLNERLEAAIDRARTSGTISAIFFIDLDRFKTINDTIAHAAGDRLLRELAARLSARKDPRVTIGRPGGDEFIVIVEGLHDRTDGMHVAHEMLATIAEPFAYEDTHIVATASIGVAFFPIDGMTQDELLRSADTAMYAAKASGGNAVEAHTAQLLAKTMAEVELERALRGALERGAIEVHYQPIIDARTGEVAALEALARWSENGKAISPLDFIPLAEETGLIVRLGSYVLEEACRYAATFVHSEFPRVTMCVNISARQFREADFAGRVARTLAASGLEPWHLQLEITEGAYIDADSGERNVRDLAELGVQLSIDDFGTGYSSLGYLKRLPVDTLKLDRSFITGIVADEADKAIVRAIIAVATILKLRVVAEGVETAEQAALLLEMGCSHLQGFYFSRPEPAGVIDSYLRKLS